MTENKRFKLKYINEQHISANLYDGGTFIGALGIGEELIVELLNDLSEENEQLKDILKDIIIQLDANHTMNTYQMVIPINRVIYNELNRRLKETSFNEELMRVLDD